MSHVGCVREENQDMGRTAKNSLNFLLYVMVWVVHSGGYEASRLAVRSMISFFEQDMEYMIQKILFNKPFYTNTNFLKQLNDGSLKGMGTTVTLLLKEVTLLGMVTLVIVIYTLFVVKNLYCSQ